MDYMKMYVCNIADGSLTNSFKFTKKNAAIAGFYQNKPVVLWYDVLSGNEKFGLVDLENGNIEEKGNVGDLKMWSHTNPCTVINDKIIAIGFNDNKLKTKIYVCNLNDGKLLNVFPLEPSKDNVNIAIQTR